MSESRNPKTRLFLSYGRRDAADLANRLRTDLEKLGYEVWQDTREIRAGKEWEDQIADGLRSTQVVIALLSPHAVRRALDPNRPDNVDSVCLDELTFARFAAPPTPIVPVMAIPCEPPFAVFRLDYVSMTQWMHSEDEYRLGFERLVAGIEAAANGKPVPFRRWHHCLPVLDFAAQLHEKRRDFVGRQWLFDEIDAWRTASSSERALLVVGDPGIGKSAFVAEMIHRNPDGQVLAYHICRADDPETFRPSTFVVSLAGMIAGRLPAFSNLLEAPQFQDLFDPKTVSGRPAHVFEQGLIAALHQLPAPPDGIRFLLIDALDEALTLGEGQLDIVKLLSDHVERFPAWLRIVATTRREPDVLNRLSCLRAASIDAHRQDNLDDIDRFIEARLQTPNLAERLAASREPLATVQRKLRDKADGNFLYVSQALQDIERDNYSFSRLNELPQGLNQWYEAWFARTFPTPGTDFVGARTVLEVVLAARESLTIEWLKDIVCLDSHYSLAETVATISQLVPERGGRFSIYHKSLADWLMSTRSRFRVSRAAGGHQILLYLRKCISPGSSLSNVYLLRHALAHLAANSLTATCPTGTELTSVRESQDSRTWNMYNGSRRFHQLRAANGLNRLFFIADWHAYGGRHPSNMLFRLAHDLSNVGMRIGGVEFIRKGPIEDFIHDPDSHPSDTVLFFANTEDSSPRKLHMRALETAYASGRGVLILRVDGYPRVDGRIAKHSQKSWFTNYLKRPLSKLVGFFAADANAKTECEANSIHSPPIIDVSALEKNYFCSLQAVASWFTTNSEIQPLGLNYYYELAEREANESNRVAALFREVFGPAPKGGSQ